MRRIVLAALGALALILAVADTAAARNGWTRVRTVGVRGFVIPGRAIPYSGVPRRPFVGYGLSPWRGWGWGAAPLVAASAAIYGFPNGYGYTEYPFGSLYGNYPGDGYPPCACGACGCAFGVLGYPPYPAW